MEAASEQRRRVWRAFTPRGAALFTSASLPRLLIVQVLVALLAGSCVGWFFRMAWFPVITHAVTRLPAQGEIRHGELSWQAASPQLLAENRFLAFGVDLHQQGQVRPPAHVYVELGRSTVRFFSLLGFTEFPYPREYLVWINRPQLEPWWGAWRPAIIALLIGGTAAGLLVVWALLAAVYMWPIWLIGFYANRQVTLRRSWRLAGAALMPAALLMSAAVLAYGAGWFRLPELGAALVLHFLVGGVCAMAVPFAVEVIPGAEHHARNPFKPPESSSQPTDHEQRNGPTPGESS